MDYSRHNEMAEKRLIKKHDKLLLGEYRRHVGRLVIVTNDDVYSAGPNERRLRPPVLCRVIPYTSEIAVLQKAHGDSGGHCKSDTRFEDNNNDYYMGGAVRYMLMVADPFALQVLDQPSEAEKPLEPDDERLWWASGRWFTLNARGILQEEEEMNQCDFTVVKNRKQLREYFRSRAAPLDLELHEKR